MFSFGNFMFGGGRRRSSTKTVKKQVKPDWFSELNATQNKELAKACKLKVTGSKGDLVARLNAHEASKVFSCNKNGYGLTLENYKQMCRERLLQVGGNKFDLVLRILQSDHGTGGDSLKRAATDTVVTVGEDGQETTVQVAKKRKPNGPHKPSPSTFATRLQKKIESVTQKKYQSHWGSKSHGPAVTYLMEELFRQAKTVVETNPRLAYECFRAIFTTFTDNFSTMERPGYCDGLACLVEDLYDIFEESIKKILTEDEIDEACSWLDDFEGVCSPYALLDYGGRDDSKTVQHLIHMLKGTVVTNVVKRAPVRVSLEQVTVDHSNPSEPVKREQITIEY